MGATVSIGQAVGAGDKRRAAVSTPEAAVEGTVRYLTVCFIGIPFITADNTLG